MNPGGDVEGQEKQLHLLPSRLCGAVAQSADLGGNQAQVTVGKIKLSVVPFSNLQNGGTTVSLSQDYHEA